MNLEKLKELEPEITDSSYEKSNSGLNKSLYWFSIFCNLCSIFLGFFFIKKTLENVIDPFYGSLILISFLSLLFLSFFELLKRYIFRKSVLKFLKKKIDVAAAGNFGIGLLIIIGSAWMSLNGANELSNKSKKIEQVTEQKINLNSDSLNKYLQTKLLKLDAALEYHDLKLKEIDSDPDISFGLKEKRKLAYKKNNELDKLSANRTALKQENEEAIKTFEKHIVKSNSAKINETKDNVLTFILITAFIEFIILFAVSFNTVFDFKGYFETANAEGYRKYQNNLILLKVIFLNGKVKEGDVLLSIAKIKEQARTFKHHFTDNDIKTLINLLVSLDVVVPPGGKYKRINKSYETTKLLLRNYYDL